MNEQLLLSNIRSVLIRQEETIIFALIERAQFRRNPVAYQAGALREAIGEESIVGYMLRETEKTHARMRRYLSPDEHPFYVGLPAPVLAVAHGRESTAAQPDQHQSEHSHHLRAGSGAVYLRFG